MDNIEIGQVWSNRFHNRESTVMHIDIVDGVMMITYRAEEPEYQKEPDTRQIEATMFRRIYRRATCPTEHGAD